MIKIPVRSLLKYSTAELWELLTGRFIIIFDDGELETDWRFTCYSSYAWDFFRKYPTKSILKKHHVQTVIGNKRLSSDTHLDLLGTVMWDSYADYGVLVPALSPDESIYRRDRMASLIYDISNEMYCDLVKRTIDWVETVDIYDFMDILTDPEIVKLKEDCLPTEDSIAMTGSKIIALIKKKASFVVNAISKALRSSNANASQVQQCIGPRGFLTDTGNEIFKDPIMRGFAEGIRGAYDTLIESRSAAKALWSSDKLLSSTEYFSRRLQLIAQQIRYLVDGDCGSERTLLWQVNNKLDHLEGRYHVLPDGTLEMIKVTDHHLIGTTIKLRSAIHCNHISKLGVCSVCYGKLFDSIPARSNAGQMNGTYVMQQSAQSVLSTKHRDASAASDEAILDDFQKDVLDYGRDFNSYRFNPTVRSKNIRLVFQQQAVQGIVDLLEAEDIRLLNLYRVTKIDACEVHIDLPGGVSTKMKLNLASAKRLVSFTYPALDYIKANGWEIVDGSKVSIDFSKWDFDANPDLFTLPAVQSSMSDHAKALEEMIESKVEDIGKRDQDTRPDAAVSELYDLVNDKLNAPVAVIELIILSTMIRSAYEKDYRVPDNNGRKSLGVMEMLVTRRSLSAAMAYEGQLDVLLSLDSFMITDRQDHPMDEMLCPQEHAEAHCII